VCANEKLNCFICANENQSICTILNVVSVFRTYLPKPTVLRTLIVYNFLTKVVQTKIRNVHTCAIEWAIESYFFSNVVVANFTKMSGCPCSTKMYFWRSSCRVHSVSLHTFPPLSKSVLHEKCSSYTLHFKCKQKDRTYCWK